MDNVRALLDASARSRMVADANREHRRKNSGDGGTAQHGFSVVLASISSDGGGERGTDMAKDIPGYWAPTDMGTIMALFAMTWAHVNILPIDHRFLHSDDMGYDSDEDRFDDNITSLTFHHDDNDGVHRVAFDLMRHVLKVWPGVLRMGNTAGSVTRINNTDVADGVDMHLVAGVSNIGETGPCGIIVAHRTMLDDKAKLAATLLQLKSKKVMSDTDDATGEGMLLTARPHSVHFYRCVVPLQVGAGVAPGAVVEMWSAGDVDAAAAISPLFMSLVHGNTVIMPGAHRWVLDLTSCADATTVGIPGVLPCCIADHAMVCVGVVCDLSRSDRRDKATSSSCIMISPLVKNRRMAHTQRYLWQCGCMRMQSPFDGIGKMPMHREAQDGMLRTLAVGSDVFAGAVEVQREPRALNGIRNNLAVRIHMRAVTTGRHSLRPRGAVYMVVHRHIAVEQDMLAKDAIVEATALMHDHRHQNMLLTVDGTRVR